MYDERPAGSTDVPKTRSAKRRRQSDELAERASRIPRVGAAMTETERQRLAESITGGTSRAVLGEGGAEGRPARTKRSMGCGAGR